MPPNDDKIKRTKEELYSRNSPEIRDSGRNTLPRDEFDVPTNWQDTNEIPHSNMKKKRSILKIVLIASVLFFLISVGVIAYSFLSNSLTVSAKNVDINIAGPVSVGAGEETSLDVVVTNNNSAVLKSARLTVEYPPGTRSTVDSTQSLTQQEIPLGDIESGQNVRKTISAVFFGAKDSINTIKTTVQYNVAGSDAQFYKEKSVDISISSAPLILTVTNPSEITSNQNFSFTATIASNASQDISNIFLEVSYPFGFNFGSATPKPISTNNGLWNIGTLKSGDQRVITINGKLQGQPNDQRTFRFTVGPLTEPGASKVSAVYASAAQTVAIQESSIGLMTLLGGSDAAEVTSQAGSQTHASISWTNNLSTKIVNTTIEAKLSGQMFDKTRVSTGDKGFYQSLNQTILWDKTSVPGLAEVAPNDKGVVGFDLVTKVVDQNLLRSINSPTVVIDITMKGTTFSDSGTPQDVVATLTRTINVSSSLSLSTITTHSTGPFTNIGPIPPKAEQETTYTVTWALTNTLNDVQNVEVSALLPSYVTWKNVSQGDGTISFDTTNNRVVWTLPRILGGTGLMTQPKTMAFQISLTPSLSQVGTEPVLLLGPKATATDTFTKTTLQLSQVDGTTRISSDPVYNVGDETVTP